LKFTTAVIVSCTAALGWTQSPAQAQSAWPAKPVRIVNPFAPGGNTDIVTRAIGDRLSPVLKQQVLIDYRPGAMTSIASEIVSKAPPDGYMLLMGGASNAINMSFLAKPPYDTLRDLEPVILCYKGGNVLAVHPSLPVKNLSELIALAKAQPGKLNYATSGLGSSNQMAGELFKMMAKVNIEHIPYKGNAPSITDTVGGHVEMIIVGIPSLLPHLQSGRLRPIAVSTLKRTPSLPKVPTFDEQGLKGYEATNWFGIFAPAKTPKDIVTRLNTEIDRAIKAPDMIERFTNEGLDTIGGSAESFVSYVRAEIAKYAKVIQAAGIAKQ
jgi:tripartite-type tricarboxylate transporter receptor subunit TctC